MPKSLREYPFAVVYLTEIVMAAASVSGEDFKKQVIDGISSWMSDDYDKLPLWLKGAASRIRERSETYAQNRTGKTKITIDNNSEQLKTIVNNSEQLPISSPLLSSQSNLISSEFGKEESEKKTKTEIVRQSYGEFKNVRLSEEEKEKLKLKMGEQQAKKYVQTVSAYKQQNGKRYKDDYAAILNFARRDNVI